MSSFFLRLFKYRPRDGRVPQEDFFTEAFAGVLQASRPLRVRFVSWLIDLHEVESVHVATQRALGDEGRVDIWIEARSNGDRVRHVLAMENKIGAPVDIDQLRRYEDRLKREATSNTRTLTLVSATRHERACFKPSPSEPAVAFKPIRWHEVADWLRGWLSQQPDGPNEPGVPLVRELLLLMEDWSMGIHLTVDDLAATTRHRTSVEGHLLQILDEVWAECVLPDSQGAWVYSQRYLTYTSPQFTSDLEARAEFGFDFERDDADWSVPQLGLPSAYFAVVGTEGPALTNRLTTLDWAPRPEDWPDNYLRAKQLDSLIVTGTSLHLIYLDFFRTAREELWQALGLRSA